MNIRPPIFVLFSLFLVTPTATAEIYLYHATSDYGSGSDRDLGTSNGVYVGSPSSELSIEQTTLQYNNGLTIEQTDFTGAWKTTTNQMQSLRFGLHYTDSDDEESNEKTTLIAETLYYPLDVYGSSLYYTKYKDDDVDVWQLSPRAGRYFWPSVIPGTLYIELLANAISINTQNESATYVSIGLSSHWSVKQLHVELSTWLGQQRSAVTDGGFTIYNLNDIYEGELRFTTSLDISNQTSIKLSGKFNQRRANENELAHLVSTLSLGLNHAF